MNNASPSTIAAGTAKTPQQAVKILSDSADAVERYLRAFLAGTATTGAPARIIEAVSYSLFAGGKRLRPALVLESARACGNSDPGSALAAAAAIELVHTFSLVHDDLPAMDDDDLRRGRPTNHKVFGEAMAILAGDAMLAMAFEMIARDAEWGAVAGDLVRELSHATGVAGMIGGQVLDMDGEHQSLSLEQLQHIHRMKTGALLTASCRLGAIAARATPQTLQSITTFGRHLGLAFQIIDDVLDLTSTPEQLGKHTRKDATHGKNTYPSLMGLEQSRAEAHRQLKEALGALQTLGSAADGLASLARFVVERNN